jgi:hypothetical protein
MTHCVRRRSPIARIIHLIERLLPNVGLEMGQVSRAASEIPEHRRNGETLADILLFAGNDSQVVGDVGASASQHLAEDACVFLVEWIAERTALFALNPQHHAVVVPAID